MRSTHIYNDYLYEGLNKSSRKSMRLWEGAAIQLKEAELTPDQIQQIFTSVEQGATASGANRTLIGRGKDAASAVNTAWEDLKTKVQDSAPIKNVDSAYDSAVAKIEAGLGGPNNAVNQVIQKYRAFAKAHPIAQSLIYAALIAAAGISGAGLGGAAVLGLLKMTDKLLQGEKFSSAAYSGAKTGATAYAAGQIGQALKGQPQGGVDPNAPQGIQPYGQNELVGAQSPGMQGAVPGDASGFNAMASTEKPGYEAAYNAYLKAHPPMTDSSQSRLAAQNIARMMAKKAVSDGVPDTSALAGSGTIREIMKNSQSVAIDRVRSAIEQGQINPGDTMKMREVAEKVIDQLGGSLPPDIQQSIVQQTVTRALGDAAKAAGGQALSVGGQLAKESINLSESTIATLFTLVQIKNRQFNEGIWDTIKQKAATVGKNLTTKVTADKIKLSMEICW